MKRYLFLPVIAFALLSTFVSMGCSAKEPPSIQTPTEAPITQHESEETHTAEQDVPIVEIPSTSVLHLIPKQATGLIYCPSLNALNDRVNMLAMDLMPAPENPEVIAKLLANAFGAAFESLDELEEIGLDMDQDFAIFMTSLNPPALSATVHLTDPAAMKQVIAAESEGTAPVEYNGVTYWNAAGGGGSFALIDNTLVFSRSSEVCEHVIDIYNKTEPAITTNPDYETFLAEVAEGTSQLAVHLNLESVAPLLQAFLEEESEAMQDSLESDSAVMGAVPVLKTMFDAGIGLTGQLKSLSATLEVEGTDVKLEPFLQFKHNSKILNTLKEMTPEELVLLDGLPSPAFINGAIQGKPETIFEMSMAWIKMLTQDADPEHAEMLEFEAFIKQAEDFYTALDKESAFSINFGSSIVPDYLIICGLKDKEKARAYMEEVLLKQLQNSIAITRNAMGDAPNLDIYDGASHGESLMHNGVEIKSYVFPNFGSAFEDMPPEVSGLMPNEWGWYYAITDNHLFLSIGSPELLKTNLDNRAGIGGISGFSEEPSYEKLATALGLENNVFLAVSPITMIKSLLPILSKIPDPNVAIAIQMFSGMFMNLPENYSISFSAKVQEGGIGAKLLVTFGDFRQLLHTLMMLQGLDQMQ